MDKNQICQFLEDKVGSSCVLVNEPMKRHTSFKIGGSADFLVMPSTVEQLVDMIKNLNEWNVPCFVMGNGTNLLVRDKGIRGVVVKLYENFETCTIEGNEIVATAGLLLSKLANFALEHNLAGLEFASGIPGTVGGAITMNAGAYGGEIKDVAIETTFLSKEGDLQTIQGKEHQFGYRTSFIQVSGGITIKSRFKLRPGSHADIKALMDDLNKRRFDKQPMEMASAGSIFKRPTGFFAGQLIDESNLRGATIGGAQISEKHCGFIINIGDAMAKDVLDLIAHVQRVVKQRVGIDLETEVRIVGEE